jgi:cytochrome c peroxidase
VAFGGRLFHEPALSANGRIACASCHQAGRGFADGLPRGLGLQRGDRNTPGLLDVGAQRWFGWDGANDSLWAQSLRPLLDPREMGGSLGSVADTVRTTPALRDGYRAAFGAAPGSDDERVAVDAAKALAAYQATLRSGRTPFDDFRDAVARGDRAAAARYPLAAQRGLAIFVGKGRCWVCHGGPAFRNGEFHDIGRPHFAEAGRVDPGRHGGIRQLQASRYNLLGPFNDDAGRTTETSTRHVALEHRNWGEFKVPSLRNLALTAPYFHDGSAATLRDVLRHYSELNEERLHADGERLLVPLKLSEAETDDLLAFLDTLNEPAALASRRPTPPENRR